MNDLYLVHHGIQGQKWGVRRFQHPDGSVTPAGAARYYVNGVRAMGDRDGKSRPSSVGTVSKKSVARVSKEKIPFGARQFRDKNGQLTAEGARRYNQYKDLTVLDKIAYKRAVKAFGRQNVSAEEIRLARSLKESSLKQMKRNMDAGMSRQEALKKALLDTAVKNSGEEALKSLAISGAKIGAGFAARAVANKYGYGSGFTEVAIRTAERFGKVDVMSIGKDAAKGAAGGFVESYLTKAVSDILYDKTFESKRHGVG